MSRSGSWITGVARFFDPTLVLVFGEGEAITSRPALAAIRKRYPLAHIVGCSTAGNFDGVSTFDDHLAVTAIKLSKTRVQIKAVSFSASGGECAAAGILARALAAPDLAHVLVFSEGIGVNGTALVDGLRAHLPGIGITGGLAGDGARMERTFILVDETTTTDTVVGIGLYGEHVRVGTGCVGGWNAFGPERLITRSKDNELFELDQRPALELYQRYLGDKANELPASGLLFPMEVRPPNGGAPVVRTLLGIDEATKSVRFAGDVPEGHYARLMTASTSHLIDGANRAATQSMKGINTSASLALLISCVGRRLVLGQRTDEELASVQAVLGTVPMTGFYSYGEISPYGGVGCQLHNQTMTITTLEEIS